MKSRQEAIIAQIDFSVTFDRVNHQAILYIYALLCGYWMFCVVYIGTVSIEPITVRYGGWLSR